MTFEIECSLERIELLTALCTRLEHLKIDRLNDFLISTVKLLLSNNNPNTRHLLYLRVLVILQQKAFK
jgi:hypothetical protein